MSWPLARYVYRWVEQHLEVDLWDGTVPRQQSQHRGEIATGAVPADRDAVGINAEVRRVLRHPDQSRGAVFYSSGTSVLRRKEEGCSTTFVRS